MAYNATTGLWKPQDDSVSGKLTGLLKTGSPYIKQAQTDAMKIANRRGLLNSTMAATAGTDAAIRSALPIASQDAGQTHAKNISSQEYRQTSGLQETDIASRERMQERELGSRASLQAADIAAAEAQLGRQLTSEELRQQRQISSAETIQERELGSRASLQAADIAAAEARLGRQLTSEELRHLRQISSAETIQQRDIAATERLQGADLESRQRIAGMNVAAHDRQYVVSAMADLQKTYAATFTEIQKNKDLSADARTKMYEHAAALRDSELNLLEQIYGIDLDWTTPDIAA